MRAGDLITRSGVERALLFFWVLISLGNFGGALMLLASNLKGNGTTQQTARYGSYTAGGFWVATYAGMVLLGFQQQFSSRRINSRRLAILKGYFVILLPTRFLYTVAWVCIVSSIDHTQEQKWLSLSCLLDILLIGRFFVALMTQPEPYAFIGIDQPDLAVPKKKEKGDLPTGYISEAKAASVVEARQRQYGPKLEDDALAPAAGEVPTPSNVIYAQREWDTQADEGGSEFCGLAHSGKQLDELHETQPSGGFLRCACCTDYAYAPMSRMNGEDLESGSSNLDYSKRLQQRQNFLRNNPISTMTGFVPGCGTAESFHNLCSVCEVVSIRVMTHLETVERRTKLEKMLHPQRELCSLKHHDNPAALELSSESCHLCALIWNTLNDEQQTRLLDEDKKLFGPSIEGSTTSGDAETQSRRAIRLVVLDDMLIPHFGGFKRPRRWEKSVPGSRGLDAEVGSEFANPLYLTGPSCYEGYPSYRDLEERRSGPLVLPVAGNTGADCVVEWISHTLKDRRKRTSWLPTRVLDVRSLHSGWVPLVMSNDLPENERTQFTALSHCWGKIMLPILKQANIQERLSNGLDVKELPRTFVEAMEVTVNLGISYIWIDSFCIIQDSVSDWDHEAALMASVYRNAFCTIAAVDAVDGNGGLFRPQHALKSSLCLIGMEGYGGKWPVYAVSHPQSDDTTLRTELALSAWNSRGWILQERYLSSAVVYFCASQVYIGLGDQLTINYEGIEPTEWSRPSFPYGESDASASSTTHLRPNQDEDHLLAAPSMHTSAVDINAISYSSRRRKANPEPPEPYQLKGQLETHGFWDYRMRKQYDSAVMNSLRTSFVEQRLGTNTSTDSHSLWWAALNEFSMRDLTKDYDKLPAVRGLAVHLHDTYSKHWKAGSDQYVMGLWRHQIIAGLLWYVDLGAHKHRPESYRAPSWSWAAVEGAISNDSLSMKEDISKSSLEFVEFDIIRTKNKERSDARPWLIDECARGTSVTIRGSVARVRWSKATSASEKRYYVARSLIRHDSEELENTTALEDLFSIVSTVPETGPLCHALLHPTTGQRIGWLLPDTPEDLPSELHCLKVAVRPRDPDDAQAIWAIRGLVLAPISFRDSPSDNRRARTAVETYRRVGYFELDCEFRGTRVGKVYSHTDEIVLHGRRSKVARYREFPVMNEPVLDPGRLFGDGSGGRGGDVREVVIV